jgi:hypothetical protein
MGDCVAEIDGTDPATPLYLGKDATKVVVSHSPGR